MSAALQGRTGGLTGPGEIRVFGSVIPAKQYGRTADSEVRDYRHSAEPGAEENPRECDPFLKAGRKGQYEDM